MTDLVLAVLAAALIAAAVAAALLLRREALRTPIAVVLVSLAAAMMIAATALRPAPVPEAQVQGRPIEMPVDGYVTSAKCRACHAHEYDTWRDSYHSTMTQRASAKSVVADFDDVTIERFGRTFHLTRDGDDHWIEMDDPLAPPDTEPRRVNVRVSMVTGSHNMQLCWFETGFTRVTSLLPFTWQIAERRWIPRLAAFVLPPERRLDPETGAWAEVCIKCHATNGRPRADHDESGLHGADTMVSEFGIACEACHGPAEKHVAAHGNPIHRYATRLGGEPDPTIVNPKRLAHVRSTQVCGQCHGNFDLTLSGRALQDFFLNGFHYRPGDDLEKTKKVQRSGWDEQFWSDGVPRVAGREYNGLVGSGCYEKGDMSCLSCHVLHQPVGEARSRRDWANDQLQLMPDDQACLQCHAGYAENTTAHTHHAPESDGSRCFNCHMPHTSYGLMKGIRNHRIASPRIATQVSTGRINACNQCHLDRTLEWTADALQKWYGTEKPQLYEVDRTVAVGVEQALRGDAAQRALIAWSFGWAPAQKAAGREWMQPYLAELLVDPYEAVRVIAERSLRTMDGFGDFRPDLLGTDQARAAAKGDAMLRWRQSRRPGDEARRGPLLLTADGDLRTEDYERLLRQRNNRAVKLFE